MSWTYSGDPQTSAKDETRFYIGDTDKTDPLLNDQEISFILKQYNFSAINAAIPCCNFIMTKFGRMADESVGQVKIMYSQKVKAYRQIKEDLRELLAITDMTPYAGGISVSDKLTNNQNTDLVRPDFSKHMMENQDIAPWVSRTLSSNGFDGGGESG